MGEDEQSSRYTTLERPKWANDIALLSLTLVSLTIIVYDTESSLLSSNPERWRLLSFIDLLLIAYFVADLAEDHTRCLDRTDWWRRNGILVLALFPLFATAIPGFGWAGMLRFIRLVPAFMAIMRLLNVSGDEEISVTRQVQHLFIIVFLLIISGGVLALMFETQYTEECTADPRCDESQMVQTVEDAIWWSIETATTVGYGEFAPKSIGARAVATVLLFVGIGLVATLAASLSRLFYSAAHSNEGNGGSRGQRMFGQLEMVTELRDKGMLTNEEFDTAKRMLFKSESSENPVDSLPRALARAKEIRGKERSQHRSRALQARRAIEEVSSDPDSD